uniref:Enhancer of polycomb-like protein n=1 Tax=Chenopodium quinoa TaxID=63459 RepID=A0A803N739_CHEQI
MPSVEMRRSTRVFVPKAKDGELVRVLRSGRRLWVESADVKHRGVKNGDDWFPLISNDSGKFKQQKINGWHDRIFRNVYSRKRKRYNVRNLKGFGESDSKKFGLHFVRRQRRKSGQTEKKQADDVIKGYYDQGLLSVFVDSSCDGCLLFSSVLSSLLKYLSKERVGLSEISTFLLLSPVSPVFASSGIHFLWNCVSNKSKGLCRISGVRQFIAMFTLDYTAAPLCFLHLHATMLFRSVRLSCLCWYDFDRKNESSDETLTFVNDQSESPPDRLVAPAKDESKGMKSVNLSPGASKLSSRNVQGRIGVLTRSASKRRRRSLRSRRARNPLPFVLQKSPGPSVSNHVSKKKAHPALPLACKQELRRSLRKSSVSEIPVQKSDLSSWNVDPDSQFCTANVLIVEADKCYRVEGAEVRLDTSASNEWLLAIKTDGTTKYSLKIQKEMRPCTTNRFTHAVIWASENGWKLEFPVRKDWAVFKELYKVCGERNIVPTSPGVKIIPVPWVCEVTNSWDPPGAFVRPESYIRTANDELSRTLSRKTANYDMDSEDEEWLSKLNSELEASNHLSEESFELAIDSFEKASYCKRDDVNDEIEAAKLCMDVVIISDVVEQVHRYWMKKRKQKRAPLIRVFQLNQPTKTQLITKPVLRKKRSLKRQTVQPMHRGRGKDSNVLQVIAAEHNAAEEQSAVLRIQEAIASADKSVELAILKRQRAQLLMENADLAMYRATMALRIADAAAEILDTQQAADHFLE